MEIAAASVLIAKSDFVRLLIDSAVAFL